MWDNLRAEQSDDSNKLTFQSFESEHYNRVSRCGIEETEVTLYTLEYATNASQWHRQIMIKHAALTDLPVALKCTLQDKKEGEGEAVHRDHAVEGSC